MYRKNRTVTSIFTTKLGDLTITDTLQEWFDDDQSNPFRCDRVWSEITAGDWLTEDMAVAFNKWREEGYNGPPPLRDAL